MKEKVGKPVFSFTLIRTNRREIVAIRAGKRGHEVELGDVVVSNGRFPGVPRGLKGVVFRILEPYVEGRTTDVIGVRWEDGTTAWMKFKDLLF